MADMTVLRAVEIIESDTSATEQEEMEAWAHLIGSGLVWHFKGYYQRNALRLIESRIISPKGAVNWELLEQLNDD